MATNGRPTKFKKEYCEQAKKLCEKGFINEELADFFNVNVDTIYEWQKRHESFSDALKCGKRYSDEKVKSALYGRALGYESVEVKEELGGSGKKITTTTKQIAGDTTAQIFWLKNRDPENWRNNPEPTNEQGTGEALTINFNVADAVSDVKVTKGSKRES